ncbi:MAG: hypothetical protein GYB68_06135 [Chloroflexi bacterium]|nr:hypothetical protein [Chloroflexota bacterium]
MSTIDDMLQRMAASKDLGLPDWGSTSRHYEGIAKRLHDARHSAYEIAFAVGHVRRKVIVPDAKFESGCHAWDALPDQSYLAYRYQIQWKDIEYADLEFFTHDEESVLARLTFVNDSDLAREYIASAFSVLRTLRHVELNLLDNDVWISADHYTELAFGPEVSPNGSSRLEGLGYELPALSPLLRPGQDGLQRGVAVADCLVGTAGLGNHRKQDNALAVRDNQTFVFQKDTRISYTVPRRTNALHIVVRYAMVGVEQLTLQISNGKGSAFLTLTHNADSPYIDFADFRHAVLSLPTVAGDTLSLTVISAQVNSDKPQFLLDGILLTNQTDAESLNERFVWHAEAPRFTISRLTGQSGVVLTSNIVTPRLALYSEAERPIPPRPYSDGVITSVLHGELDGVQVSHKLHNEMMVSWYGSEVAIQGDGSNHFAGYNIGPIVVEPGETRVVYCAITCAVGSSDDVLAKARMVHHNRHATIKRIEAHYQRTAPDFAGSSYGFSQHKEYVQLATNVVYPTRLGDEYVSTYTPGKRWGGLYTWDAGMHGIGLAEYDLTRSLDIMNQYTVDNPDIEAVLHGPLVPLHIYLMNEIFQKTGDNDLLDAFYDRLKRYVGHFLGEPPSRFDAFGDGLLTAFFDGFNAFGVDDYPAQHFVGINRMFDQVSSVSPTAHGIRAAKIMRLFAYKRAHTQDGLHYDRIIDYLTEGLQSLAWDERSGYYSYVIHESKQHLTTPDGINFNMGLDGVAPLVADVSTPAQKHAMIANLMTEGRLWTPYGITTVAQDAPYYRHDGYWNGKIWIPHQWFMWKALIGEGELAHAERIALTALDLWKRETDDSYNCWESFDVKTGQGQGAHQFAGLSGPIAAFYHGYFTPGRFAVGFDTVIEEHEYDPETRHFLLTVSTPLRQGRTGIVMAVGEPGPYQLSIDGYSHSVESQGGWLNVALDLSVAPRTVVVEPAG